jgi:hypothetical protein
MRRRHRRHLAVRRARAAVPTIGFDVIVTQGGAAVLAAKQATSVIPIIFAVGPSALAVYRLMTNSNFTYRVAGFGLRQPAQRSHVRRWRPDCVAGHVIPRLAVRDLPAA